MKIKKVFVTGAMGFIGFNWCKKLLENGYEVYAIDIKKKNKKLNNYKKFKYFKDSVFNYDLVRKLIKNTDLTCHFAGIASPKEYLINTNKVIDLTVNPSLVIINACSKYRKKLFFTSTSEIYGKSIELPFKEDGNRYLGSTRTRRWCYSTAKALVEHAIFAKLSNKKKNFIIYRLFNIYGYGLEGRVVDKFFERAIKNRDLEIFGTGREKRCFLYIDDCIEIFFKILTKNKFNNQILNIGNNKEETIISLARKIIKISNSKSKIKIKSLYAKNKMKSQGFEDIPRRIPSLVMLKKTINHEPKISLNSGLKLYLENKLKNKI